MKISPTKEKELYGVVHEEIMRTRIQIAKLLKYDPQGTKIDDLLSNLMRTAPQAAIQCFKPKDPTKPKEYPEYKQFIDIWDQQYHQLLQMPKDGAKVKSLIDQTRNYIKSGGNEPTEENVLNFWTAFVGNLHRTWAHNKSLSTIDSKYYELIFELKHGRKTSTQKPSAAELIRSL